jgi:Ankyrin repeat
MKALFSLLAVTLLVTAALTLGAGTLNHFFDLGLGLGIGGFDLELPDQFGAVVALAVTQVVMSMFFELLANPGRLKSAFQRRPKTYSGLGLILVAMLVGGFLSLAGGPLGLAVEAGDTAKVQALLQDGNFSSDELNPHLYQALKAGRIEMAQALLQAGADPNQRSGEFQTPLLSSAVTWFPKNSVLWLAEQRPESNSKDSFGRTSIHLLALYRAGNFPQETSQDQLEILQVLEKAGADLNLAADDGSTLKSLVESKKLSSLSDYLKTKGL